MVVLCAAGDTLALGADLVIRLAVLQGSHEVGARWQPSEVWVEHGERWPGLAGGRGSERVGAAWWGRVRVAMSHIMYQRRMARNCLLCAPALVCGGRQGR